MLFSHETKQNLSQSRWEEDTDGIMKPVINYIHVIPIEDTMLHCAQRTCWCYPKLNPADDIIYLHQAVSPEPERWVCIGELENSS